MFREKHAFKALSHEIFRANHYDVIVKEIILFKHFIE